MAFKTIFDLPQRIQDKIMPEPMSGCWLWLGSRQAKGYGCSWSGEASVLAHRYVYQIIVGEIPKGLEIDHKCRNRSCVNPDHLEPVTHEENCIRSRIIYRKPLACPRGHPYIPENTFLRPSHYGTGRAIAICRECTRYSSRNSYKKMKKLHKSAVQSPLP